MKQFIGIASCDNENEAAKVVNSIAFIGNTQIHQEGNRVEVIYIPNDMCSSLEEDRTVKRILDIIEPISEHGFSIIS